MKQKIVAILLLILGIYSLRAAAQTPNIGITANLALGEVTKIDSASNQIELNTKDGAIAIMLNDKVEFKRVSPDKPADLSAAVPSSLTDINVGDRIVAQGKVAEDKKTILARRVILMTKADIAKKQETDREKWTVRGVAGRVTAINPITNEITVAARGAGAVGGERSVIIAANEKTSFRRYAPGSVQFNDARTSSLNEVKTGDQLRAYGEKSADGARLTAEEVVSGSFRMIAGKVTAIDATNNTVAIKDTNNKDVKITINNNTLLRRFPTEMAERMAQFQGLRAGGQLPPGMAAQNAGAGSSASVQPNANAAGAAPNGQRPPGAQGGMMRPGVGGRGDLDEMLERLPALTLSDLKPGDAIAVLSGGDNSSTNDSVSAIKFVAGVEPFLRAPQAPTGGATQGNRSAQSAPTFNIPGLDSIGAP